MNCLRPTIFALVLTMMVSSTTLAGNIGGLRTNSAGNIGGVRTSSVGNIGGLRTSSATNVDKLTNDVETKLTLGISLSGNIGGLIQLFLESSALF